MNSPQGQFETPNPRISEIETLANTGALQLSGRTSTDSKNSPETIFSGAVAATQCDQAEAFEADCRWCDDGGNQWIRCASDDADSGENNEFSNH